MLGTVLLLRWQIFKQTDGNTAQSQPAAGFTGALLNNLDNPFIQKDDTLILKSVFQPCGNCSAKLPIDPRAEDIPFIDKLSMLVNKKIPPAIGSNQIMDTVQIYGILNRGSEHAFRSKKIYVLVRAEQSRETGRLYVYENYLYIDSFKQVLKEFELDKKGTWREIDHGKTE